MPRSMRRPCSNPGCQHLVKHGRCDDHPYTDRHDPESQRLYNTTRWHSLRDLQLTRDPWCAECLKDEIYTIATEVDHLVPHRGDPVLFFTGALQSLCKICHSRKTLEELRGGGRKSLKSGAPERAGPALRKMPEFRKIQELGGVWHAVNL